MKSYKEYFQYYQNLRETPSVDYLQMGEFGKCCWDHKICEGLITSYPQEKVAEFLKQLSTGDDFDVIDNYDKHLLKVIVTPIKNDIYAIVDILNDKLKLFGYKVGRHLPPDHFGDIKIIIEPIHSTEVDASKIGTLYHLTHKKYLDSIKKIGLSPRESTTLFTHPGGRIYLFTVDTILDMDILKYQLTALTKHKPNNRLPHLQPTPENMVALKIKQPYTFKLFEDPMFGGSSDFRGYFTPDNISPKDLEIVP